MRAVWPLRPLYSVCVVFRAYEFVLLHVLDNPEIGSHRFGGSKVFEVLVDMQHSIAPVPLSIAVASEGRFVAEGAKGCLRRREVDEVGLRMGYPLFHVRRVEPQITTKERKLAWQVIAVVTGWRSDKLLGEGWRSTPPWRAD